jgi:hypothetical protein
MTTVLRIRFLPARFGDAIWIEYGDENVPHRVLIDGGTRGTRHDLRPLLQDLPSPDGGRMELLVITHFDRDHIEGVLGLLEDPTLPLDIGDVWFNGWGHLPENPPVEGFGAVQGERLTKAILERGLPWNRAFGGKAVATAPGAPLPSRSLPGGLELTLLSPAPEALLRLKPVWEREVRAANLDPGFGLEPNDDAPEGPEGFGAVDLPDVEALADTPFEDDRSEANASSIAFLASWEGRRVLFAADAPAGTVLEALDRISPHERLALDLFKISHHGSRSTTSRPLIEKVDCPRYVFSTNGSIFRHPHGEAVARVIVAGGPDPELIFNYRSKHNEIWDLGALRRRHGYRTRYPDRTGDGVTVSL